MTSILKRHSHKIPTSNLEIGKHYVVFLKGYDNKPLVYIGKILEIDDQDCWLTPISHNKFKSSNTKSIKIQDFLHQEFYTTVYDYNTTFFEISDEELHIEKKIYEAHKLDEELKNKEIVFDDNSTFGTYFILTVRYIPSINEIVYVVIDSEDGLVKSIPKYRFEDGLYKIK